MKRWWYGVAVMLTISAALTLGAAPRQVAPEDIAKIFAENRPGHPRLFLRDYAELQKSRQTPVGAAMAGRVFYDADKMLGYPVVAPRMTGDQMLSSCRNILYRINTLVMAYRLSGDRRYADRAIAEMRNAAGFPTWNPKHYLDVAELTLAMSIGYDWLYDLLSDDDRKMFAAAIIQKGIEPSWGNVGIWWVNGTNNWNQVCHAGMTAGAIVTFEDNPELAAKTIARAVNHLPTAMKAAYDPHGAYPEGPIYWSYGSEFTVALLAMLESTFNTDFELSSCPGFSETGDFVLAARAPSGKGFNYADAVPSFGVDLAQVWLPRRFNRPDWMTGWTQQELLNAGARRLADVSQGGPRMLPLSMIFFTDYGKTDNVPPKSYYSGSDAAVPVAMFRSDWSNDAAYLGVKAGSPSWSHGHMDAGGFVYEVDGVRWAADLGQDNYDRFLSRKMSLWSYAPESDRWNIFRIGPMSHNILVIDNQLQIPTAKALIKDVTDHSAKVDLSPMYENEAKQVIRSFTLQPDRSLDINDRIVGAKPGVPVKWQMLLQGVDAQIEGKNILLSSGNKQLLLECVSPVDGTWSVIDTKTLEAEWDSPNPGCKMIIFEQKIPADGTLDYTMRLKPQPAKALPPSETMTLGTKRQPREEAVLDALSAAPGVTVSAEIKLVQKYADDKAWKSAGIGIYRDSQNQFLLAFCESPVAGGSRHFIELKQRQNNQWESLTGIKKTEFRANYQWQYGEPYRLELAVSANLLVGSLKSADGALLAKIEIPVISDAAVITGSTILFTSGIEAVFSNPAILK